MLWPCSPLHYRRNRARRERERERTQGRGGQALNMKLPPATGFAWGSPFRFDSHMLRHGKQNRQSHVLTQTTCTNTQSWATNPTEMQYLCSPSQGAKLKQRKRETTPYTNTAISPHRPSGGSVTSQQYSSHLIFSFLPLFRCGPIPGSPFAICDRLYCPMTSSPSQANHPAIYM